MQLHACSIQTLTSTFRTEEVADDRYGFDVYCRVRQNMPTPTCPIVPYTNWRRLFDLGSVVTERKAARHRMRSQSPVRRRYTDKSRQRSRGRNGSRTAQASKRSRAQSSGPPPAAGPTIKFGEAVELAKSGQPTDTVDAPITTEAGIGIKTITDKKVRIGTAIELTGATDWKDGPSAADRRDARVCVGTHQGECYLTAITGDTDLRRSSSTVGDQT